MILKLVNMFKKNDSVNCSVSPAVERPDEAAAKRAAEEAAQKAAAEQAATESQ